MPKTQPPLNLALTLLRLIQGWTQRELAEVSGIPANLLSDYERGRKPISRERLEFLSGVMGLSTEMIDLAISFVRTVRTSSPAAGLPNDAQRRRIEIVASDLGAKTADFARWALTRLTTAGQAEKERQEAEAVWARLKEKKPVQRRRIIEESAKIRTWALCERVCRDSVDAARDSADRALELAELALRIAELTAGEEAWRSRVQGYAWAHVGNARRVRGDLPGADEAFRRANQLWQVGAAVEFQALDEARVLDLEASLRRAQGRFQEALGLLDQALAANQDDRAGRILLNKATVLEALGAHEEAVKALRQAFPHLDGTDEPRLVLALRFNLAVNLWFLNRHKEVSEILPEIRGLATRLGNRLDLVRLRWLEGRVAAGLGNREEAVNLLVRVKEEFTTREIGFEAALVSLELAAIYLEDDRVSEVRSLSQQMMWIFQGQGVARETLAALKLFCQAVELEEITLDWTQRIIRYLYRAQHDPSLQFEGPA